MGEQAHLSRESFRFLAEAAGLNPQDPHMERLRKYLLEALPKLQGAAEAPREEAEKDLHTFIQRYMPALKRLADLDVGGLDPALSFRPPAGADR